MTTLDVTRLLQGGATAALSLTGIIPSFAQDAQLRMFWRGAKERAERTDKVSSFPHPDVHP